jgi:hypothetical protein
MIASDDRERHTETEHDLRVGTGTLRTLRAEHEDLAFGLLFLSGGKASAPAARQLIAFGTTLDAPEASLGLPHPIPPTPTRFHA